MKRRSPAVPALVCALTVLAGARTASAQTEVYGGYSYLQDPGNSVLAITARDNRFPLGWAAGAARPAGRPWLAGVGEVSGHYKRRTSLDDPVRVSFHAFMAGPRARVRLGKLTEFAQVLAGVTHGRASAFGMDVGVTAVSVQPGGGIEYPLGSRLAARFELDYRWIRNSADGREHASQFRAVAALVYR
jgi:hypothetical protein